MVLLPIAEVDRSRMPSGRFLAKVLPAEPLTGVEAESARVSEEPDKLLGQAEAPRAPVLGFDEIYRSFVGDVSRWIRALGGPDADRDDLVQDVFVIVHRRLADFDGSNLPGWLYQIARHRVRDFRRLQWFKVLVGRGHIDNTACTSVAGPEAAFGNKEKAEALAHLLTRLPEAQRAAFVLFEVDGYSGEEIARLQGVPVNTVWARVHKARLKLAARLHQYR
jgi:RNA polymerase sigma-70 factor, ECF subfamily